VRVRDRHIEMDRDRATDVGGGRGEYKWSVNENNKLVIKEGDGKGDSMAS
jgi:hypothetical protein